MLFHGYLVFASTFLLNFITAGQFNSSSLYLYLDPLQKSFPESGGGTLAVFCTIQVVAGLASSLVGGIAQDALESAGIGLSWLFFSGGLLMFLGLVISWGKLCANTDGSNYWIYDVWLRFWHSCFHVKWNVCDVV